MTKFVIFDLDGTLIDAYPAVEETLNYTLSQCGMPPVDGDVIKRTVGWGDRHLVRAFVGEERIGRAIEIYRRHHRESLLRGSSLLPGALDLLMGLKRQGLLLAVASNRPKEYSVILTRHLGIARLFDRIVCGDEVARPKPAPDILLKIMEELGCGPQETCYIGDMTIDVETGQAAGVRTIVIPTGSSTLQELEEAGAWRVVADLSQIPGLLSKIH